MHLKSSLNVLNTVNRINRYKFCSIHINITKYDVTVATKGGSNPLPRGYATTLTHSILFEFMFEFRRIIFASSSSAKRSSSQPLFSIPGIRDCMIVIMHGIDNLTCFAMHCTVKQSTCVGFLLQSLTNSALNILVPALDNKLFINLIKFIIDMHPVLEMTQDIAKEQ